MEGPSGGAAEALESSATRERGGTSTSLPLPHPAGPMTYTELTRSGVGRTMPELLWVPYFSDPSPDQLQAASSTSQGEGLEGNRRELSKSVDSIGRSRNSRNQPMLASDGKTKEKPWLHRKVIEEHRASFTGSPGSTTPMPALLPIQANAMPSLLA